MKKLLHILVLLACLAVPAASAVAGTGRPLLVAVAANFAPAMAEIGARFTGRTGIPVQTTVSSSGRLYAQIRNRAPFSLFLSADTRRPQLLFEQGFCRRPEVYVRGRTVLWSRDPKQCRRAGDWKRLVASAARTGIPNPELAPYGAAARQALVSSGLWEKVAGRLVYGANVAQSFQYAASGATTVSFISRSLAATATGAGGCFLPVPEAEAVAQAACVITTSPAGDAALALLRFLRRDSSEILARYGYSR